jgi:hypothetical protein
MQALAAALCGAALLVTAVSGCAVVTVASAVATVAVGVASTAVDVGVGAAKVTAKVVGKGVDLITPSGPQPPAAPSLPKPGSR